ncbi:MAG: hypothetical protein ACLQIQ_13175 [Beijerinckiaceae bacterium]
MPTSAVLKTARRRSIGALEAIRLTRAALRRPIARQPLDFCRK